MRIKLHLDEPVIHHQRLLIHGPSNAGKTYLAGSAMRETIDKGGTAYFIDLKGEEGTRTLATFGLGSEVAETAEDYQDLVDITADLMGAPRDLVVLDSLKFVWKMAINKRCGEGKAPVITRQDNPWVDIHTWGDNIVSRLFRSAKDVIVICSSDRSMDQIRDETWLTPDLPGRKATEIGGAFDLVGYQESNVIGAKNTRRVLHFENLAGTITKARARTPFTRPIILDNGPNVWGNVQTTINEHV